MAVTATSRTRLILTVQGGPGGQRDFVGLYRCGDGDHQFLDWVYLSNVKILPPRGLTSATVSLDCPVGVSGNYEMRFVGVTGTTVPVYTCYAKGMTVAVGSPAAALREPIVTETAEPILDDAGVAVVTE